MIEDNFPFANLAETEFISTLDTNFNLKEELKKVKSKLTKFNKMDVCQLCPTVQKELSDKQSHIDRLESELKQSKCDLKSCVEPLQKEIENSKIRYEADFHLLLDTHKTLRERNFEIKRINAEKDTLSKQFSDLKEQYDKLKQDFDILDQDYINLNSQYQNLWEDTMVVPPPQFNNYQSQNQWFRNGNRGRKNKYF